ncbi:MAG: hypothetical protein ACXWR0_15375 [Bdellovibrio sp.]
MEENEINTDSGSQYQNKKYINKILDSLAEINFEEGMSEIQLHKTFRKIYEIIFNAQKRNLGLWYREDSNQIILNYRLLLKNLESEYLESLKNNNNINASGMTEKIANTTSKFIEKYAGLIQLLTMIPFNTYRTYELPLDTVDVDIESTLRSDNRYYAIRKSSGVLLTGVILSVLLASAYIIADEELSKDKIDKAIDNIDRIARFKVSEEIAESEKAYANSSNKTEKQMLLNSLNSLKQVSKDMEELSFRDYVLYIKSSLIAN